MVPEYNYSIIPNEWSAPHCCEKDPPNDPYCEDCCYDTWRKKLKEVVQDYSREKEIADQVQKRLEFLTSRRSRYRTWVEELDKAEDYARAICHQLDILSAQTYKIWHNACHAVDAIEILFCMIRHFYTQVDALKSKYDDLQVCISSNTNPALVNGTGILLCLTEYKTKLESLIKTRDDIIKVILEAVRIAHLLRNNIYTKPCDTKPCEPGAGVDPCKDGAPPCDCHPDDNSENFYGYRTILCELYCSMKCDEDCTPTPTVKGNTYDAKDQPQPKNSELPTEEKPCCYEVDFDFKPIIKFPICNSQYKADVQEYYKNDDRCVTALSDLLKDKNKNKEALLACKNGLDKAIAEADPKNRCK